MTRWGLPLAAVLMTLAVCSFAAAQQGTGERADLLFREGRDAMRGRDYVTACHKFAESQQLDPAPGTLLNLSECEEALGRLAAAWQHIQQTIQQLPANDNRLPLARERAAALDRRVPRITVNLAPEAPAGTQLTLDGQPVAVGMPTAVDPGSHTITAEAPGYPRKATTVVVNERESPVVQVAPEPPSSGGTLATPSSGSSTRTWGYVIGGVGIAGLGLATATGIVMSGKKSTVDAHCHADKVCDSVGYDAAQSGQRLQPFYLTGWIVGGVGIVAGTYLIFKPSSKSTTTAQLGAGTVSGGAGLTLSGSFQ